VKIYNLSFLFKPLSLNRLLDFRDKALTSLRAVLPQNKLLNPVLRRIARVSSLKRRAILFTLDVTIFAFSSYAGLYLRFDDGIPPEYLKSFVWLGMISVLTKSACFYLLGMYRPLLRYSSFRLLETPIKATIASETLLFALSYLLQFQFLPRSSQVISGFITVSLVMSLRILIRRYIRKESIVLSSSTAQSRVGFPDSSSESARRKVLIYGAGSAGSILSSSLVCDAQHEVEAFIDDNPRLSSREVNGLRIYRSTLLESLVENRGVELVLLAMPSISNRQRQSIIQRLNHLDVEVLTVPTLEEIVSGKVAVDKIRPIDINDCLGRSEVLPDPTLLAANILGKVVLVTGAGGSIGSELCRQIAQQQPKEIVLYEISELALYSIDLELAESYGNIPRSSYLGSVTNRSRLDELLDKHKVDTVYHAAAYKHVPLVEANPAQGIINNAYGTLVVAQASQAANVETFVLISTDKAVRPTNVMGATKRIAELILQAMANQSDVKTRFIMVRFGNVLGSSGSVVPRFRKQISEGQPITLTHRDITRYFMSIPEAARLVIQAGAMGEGGEVFLLDMGKPVKIYDLAVQMIELSGLQVEKDIEIKITGLRPGEKLYEELLIDSSCSMPTEHPKIYAAKETMLRWNQLEPELNKLILLAQSGNALGATCCLKNIVPEYKAAQMAPSCSI